jgi:hypothetical protein
MRLKIPYFARINCNFGILPKDDPLADSGTRLFAFALSDRTVPRVFEFDATPDGINSVANLIRTENVLEVVKGKRVSVSRFSVVTLDTDEGKIEDRLLLSDKELL